MFLHVGIPGRLSAALLALVLVSLPRGASADSREMTWDFESDEPGTIATGFLGVGGRWEVAEDEGNRAFVQKAEGRHQALNVALIEETSYKNVDLSVRIKAGAGENERGGGVVWRARDKDNFYAVRLNPYVSRHNPREPNCRLFKVENGVVTQLDHAVVGADVEWHTLRIRMIGTEIIGSLDGKPLLYAEDGAFQDVGKIGLWSRSDARPAFDDLKVSSPTPGMPQ